MAKVKMVKKSKKIKDINGLIKKVEIGCDLFRNILTCYSGVVRREPIYITSGIAGTVGTLSRIINDQSNCNFEFNRSIFQRL